MLGVVGSCLMVITGAVHAAWPHLFFINLDTRSDLKAHMLSELAAVDYPMDRVHRVPGVQRANGALGCALSHVRALQAVKRMDAEVALIVEDDFKWQVKSSLVSDTMDSALSNASWAVCLLMCNGVIEPTGHPHLGRVRHCQTTGGYMVRARAFDLLLRIFTDTIALPANSNTWAASRVPKHHIDQAWKVLQRSGEWRATQPLLGTQLPGYSNIKHINVDYSPLLRVRHRNSTRSSGRSCGEATIRHDTRLAVTCTRKLKMGQCPTWGCDYTCNDCKRATGNGGRAVRRGARRHLSDT